MRRYGMALAGLAFLVPACGMVPDDAYAQAIQPSRPSSAVTCGVSPAGPETGRPVGLGRKVSPSVMARLLLSSWTTSSGGDTHHGLASDLQQLVRR